MSQLLRQNQAGEVLVRLYTDQMPYTLATWDQVAVSVRKAGGAFAPFAVTSSTFIHTDGGIYVLTLAAADTDVIGTLAVRVTGAAFDDSLTTATIISQAEPEPALPLDTCAITGRVCSINGQPLPRVSVVAHVLGLPQVEQRAAVSGDTISVRTDANGEFVLLLVQGADVVVTIAVAGYRRQFVVPYLANANLFAL